MAGPKKEGPKVVKQLTDEEPLADAGHTRQEQLKKRHDALMAEKELLEQQMAHFGSIDPSKLDIQKIPREVMAAMDFAQSEIYVSNAQSDYRYAWIYADPMRKWGNRSVRAMQVAGFECVMGDMPEAPEHAHGPSRERFVADCILMRCRIDRYMQLQLYKREQRLRRQDGISAGLRERAARAGVRVFDKDSMPAHIQGYMQQQGEQRRIVTAKTVPPSRVQRRAAAKRLALDKFDAHLRAGNIPGLSPEEAARRS